MSFTDGSGDNKFVMCVTISLKKVQKANPEFLVY